MDTTTDAPVGREKLLDTLRELQDGCKKAIVPREELLGKRKWADLSSSKKQMLVRPNGSMSTSVSF